MASLRGWLEEAGFTDVETHIQTGNLKVGSRLRSPRRVEERLESLLAERCGFEVPCIVLTPAELRTVYADALALDAPFGDREGQRRYVVFFKNEVSAEETARMGGYDSPDERIWALGRAVHVWICGSFHDARVFAAFKGVLATGTNRDLKVVAAVVEKWAS